MSKSKDPLTGIVYTKNTDRVVISAGPDGPLGDMVIAYGKVYRNPALSGSPVGRFDLSAITTSIDGNTERREVSIEISFNKAFARKSWIAKLEPSFKAKWQSDEVSINGVETYPVGGAILDRPLTLGISTGTGQFIGAVGTASISYSPGTEFFTYALTIA